MRRAIEAGRLREISISPRASPESASAALTADIVRAKTSTLEWEPPCALGQAELAITENARRYVLLLQTMSDGALIAAWRHSAGEDEPA
jgi:hypothetical protein